MKLHQSETIRYYTFNSFAEADVTHAIFTRLGGSSPEPWESLNLGGTVGDDPNRVNENRRRAFQALERPTDSLYDVWQVHGTEVVCAQAPRLPDLPHKKADAILTNQPHITLFMRFADCVPVLLFDPRLRVVGLVHAGWQGTVQRVVSQAIQAMQERYGSRPMDILAGIGPSIGVHHYQVGPEVVRRVHQAFGEDAHGLLRYRNGNEDESGVQFDLWSANQLILEQSGVRQIEVSGLCTACHVDEWYSHRAEKGQTGRFGVLIAL